MFYAHPRQAWAQGYEFNMAAILYDIVWSADMLFILTTKTEESYIAKETNSQ